jgi:hypothetical protein
MPGAPRSRRRSGKSAECRLSRGRARTEDRHPSWGRGFPSVLPSSFAPPRLFRLSSPVRSVCLLRAVRCHLLSAADRSCHPARALVDSILRSQAEEKARARLRLYDTVP